MTGRSLGRLWKGSGTPKKNWAKVEQVFPLPLHSPCDEHHPDAPDPSGRSLSWSWSWSYHDWLPIMQGSNLLSRHRNPVRFGRHYYITKVSCVSPQKPLPPIDGFQRSSSDSSLPEFATWDDRKNGRKLFSNRSHPLAEGQVLKSTGICSFSFPLSLCQDTNTNELSIKIFFLRSSAPILSYPGSLNYGPRRR